MLKSRQRQEQEPPAPTMQLMKDSKHYATRIPKFSDREAAVIIAHGQHKRKYREKSMEANGRLQYIAGVAAGKQNASTEGVLVLDDAAAEPSDPSLPLIPCVSDPGKACVDGPVDQPEQPQAYTRVYNATSLPVAKVAQIRPHHSHGVPGLVP